MTTTSILLAALAVAAVLLAAVAVALVKLAGDQRRMRDELVESRASARTEQQTLEAFRSMASETLSEQSTQLLDLADTRYQGLEKSAEARWAAQSQTLFGRLEGYSRQLTDLEKERREDSGSLRSAVNALREHTEGVQAEAASLASALRDNSSRGLWGEVQLRRALEASGMLAHADFTEQLSVAGESRTLRPDVVVHLPNDRCIVVDAKAPLDAFLRASDAEGTDRDRHLTEHGAAVARHAADLARRDYTEHVDGAVDFVVLFIPGDAYLSAAIEGRPELIEQAWGKRVLLATPTSLIGLLRGVALGWRERQLTERAEHIAELGRELHKRVGLFAEHLTGVGRSLGRSVDSYNQAMASMESRLLVTARRLGELGADSEHELPSAEQIDGLPRLPAAPELRDPENAA